MRVVCAWRRRGLSVQLAVVKTEDRKHGEGPFVKTPDSLNLVQRRLTVTPKTKPAQHSNGVASACPEYK